MMDEINSLDIDLDGSVEHHQVIVTKGAVEVNLLHADVGNIIGIVEKLGPQVSTINLKLSNRLISRDTSLYAFDIFKYADSSRAQSVTVQNGSLMHVGNINTPLTAHHIIFKYIHLLPNAIDTLFGHSTTTSLTYDISGFNVSSGI